MKKELFSSSVVHPHKANLKPMLAGAIVLFSFFFFSFSFLGTAHTQGPRGVIRLKVKYKSGATTKELPRKRFFLIKGNLEENKGLIEKIKQTATLSRECYYRSKGASVALIKWLNENDCESVYCREIEEKYLAGSEAVPEFKAAYDVALREFKNPELARRWLTVNLPAELRDGFYKQKQELINALLKQAEETTRTKVASVMLRCADLSRCRTKRTRRSNAKLLSGRCRFVSSLRSEFHRP